jgi:HEAT repeat protein
MGRVLVIVAAIGVLAFPAAMAGHGPTALAQKSQPVYQGKPLDELINELRQSQMERREAALKILKKEIGPEGRAAVPALIQALNDPNAGMRDLAINCLASVGPAAKEAVPALIALVLKDDNWACRGNGAYALGRTGSKAAIPALLKAFGDKKSYVRENAAQAVVMIGPSPEVRKALPMFIAGLADEEYWVRVNSANVLAMFGREAKDAVPVIAKLVDGTKHLSTLSPFYDALAGIGERGVPCLIKVYQRANSEGDDWGRRYIASAIASCGPKATSAVPVLGRMLTDTQDARLKVQLADILAAIGPAAKAAVPTLEKALKETDNRVKKAAALALWRIDPKIAIREGAPAPVTQYWAFIGVPKADFDRNHPIITATACRGERIKLTVNGTPIPLKPAGGWIIGLNGSLRSGKNQLVVTGTFRRPVRIMIESLPNNNVFLRKAVAKGSFAPDHDGSKNKPLVFTVP